MAITYLDGPHGNGSGIANAMNLWDQFFGLGHDLRQQQLTNEQTQAEATKAGTANTQAQLPGIKAQAEGAQRENYLADQAQKAKLDAEMLTPQSLNEGFTKPLETQPRFWSQLDKNEQAHVLGHFVHNDLEDSSFVPPAYDAWVSRQYNVLPPMRMPVNMNGMGTGAFGMTGMKVNEKGVMEPTFGPIVQPFRKEQMDVIKQGPEGVVASPLFGWHERDKAVEAAKGFETTRQQYSKELMEQPAIRTYLGGGSGEQPGVLSAWRDVDGFRRKHTDAKGNWTSDLSPQEATALVYRMGRIDNPGAIVRQQEFETIAQNAGIYDRIVAHLKQAEKGLGLPMATAKDIFNVLDQLKSGAEQRFNESLVSWEPMLAKRGLDMEDVVHDPAALKAFRAVHGPMMPDEATAKAHLPPGARFHLPGDTLVGIVPGGQQQPSIKPATIPAAPEGRGTPAPVGELKPGNIRVTQPPAAPAQSAAMPSASQLPPAPQVADPVAAAIARHPNSVGFLDNFIHGLAGHDEGESKIMSAIDMARYNEAHASTPTEAHQAHRDQSILTQELRKRIALRFMRQGNTVASPTWAR